MRTSLMRVGRGQMGSRTNSRTSIRKDKKLYKYLDRTKAATF